MKPKILVFAGSIRNGSYNRKLARALAEALMQSGADVTLADLRDYPMPMYDGDLEASGGLPEKAKAFKELLRAHDAFAIASPEYNGSFPALLKNAIDWVSRPEPGERPAEVFRGKTAALASGSPGPGGGQRGLRHLRELLGMIGVTVIAEQLAIPRVGAAFDQEGRLVRPEDAGGLRQLATALDGALEARRALVA